MTNSHAKGARWESDVVNTLRRTGYPQAHRTRTPGYEADRGDIGGLPCVIECKNQKAWRVHDWIAQAEEAGERCGQPWAVVAKRPGTTDPMRAIVMIELEHFLELLAAWEAA